MDVPPGLAARRGFLVYMSLAIPALAGFLATGTLAGAAGGLLWGGLVRIFFVHHITWSVNSVCHFLGSRRFDTDDRSTNVFWLALPSLGESWHHNHHAFPRSAVHGLKRWEPDPSALIIATLAAFPIARGHLRGSNYYYPLFLSGILIPAGIIPQFFIMQQLGIYDTRIGYILLWWSRIALPIFILTGFIKGIPSELNDAAAIDGCPYIQYVFQIIVPLLKPALSVVGLILVILLILLLLGKL